MPTYDECSCGSSAKWDKTKEMFICPECNNKWEIKGLYNRKQTKKREEVNMKSMNCPECDLLNEWDPKEKSYVCACGNKYRGKRKDKGVKPPKPEPKPKKEKKKRNKKQITSDQEISCFDCIHKDVCALKPTCPHYRTE